MTLPTEPPAVLLAAAPRAASPAAPSRNLFEDPPPRPSNEGSGEGTLEQAADGMTSPGDGTSFDRLVEEHLAPALRFATRLTGGVDAAEELVQEALLRAWRGRDGFRAESQFRTWLFRIVINVFRDRLAGRKTAEPLPAELTDERQIDPAAAASDAELGRRIAELVGALPPRQREVLVLVTYEGMDAREAAAVLGVTPANVHSTLHVARERLRRQLAPYLSERRAE